MTPPIGPPGFVTLAKGTNFPPGATVSLVWSEGITARANTVRVAPDGTFVWQALVFRHDVLGRRVLDATRVAGTLFGPVRSNEFLVVPGTLQPPDFKNRR